MSFCIELKETDNEIRKTLEKTKLEQGDIEIVMDFLERAKQRDNDAKTKKKDNTD